MSVSLLKHILNDSGVVSVLITDASLEFGIVLPHGTQENGFKWMNEQTGLHPSECSRRLSFLIFSLNNVGWHIITILGIWNMSELPR